MGNSKHPLVLRKLTKRYGTSRGIKNVDLTIKPGEVFGFLGPNGAGKTTTIRTIMNFLRPSEGSVQVFGLDSVSDDVEIKKRVGFLSGDLELYDNLTGKQYLEFISHLRGVSDHQQIHELCERLGATPNQRIRTLSRGNKQKIGLVAALIHDPDLLILDEPTSGLDPLVQNQFYEIVREHTKKGKTVFMSSHVLSEVQTICDRVGFMRFGELIETVDVSKLLKEAKKEVTLVSETKELKVPSLPGLEVVEKRQGHLKFQTSASADEILKWLQTQKVKDITIQNTSLDEMFLKLYGEHQEEPQNV